MVGFRAVSDTWRDPVSANKQTLRESHKSSEIDEGLATAQSVRLLFVGES